MNILELLEKRVSSALVAAGLPEGTPAMVRPSVQARFGDYQCNAIMAAAKKLGSLPNNKADRISHQLALADRVVQQLDLAGIAEKTEVASPGFINIYLDKNWLSKILDAAWQDERLSVERSSQPDTVVVDYSAPNVAKEMHIGHIRSTIIGDATSRVLEFLGHRVIRQNHIGDWGTQFGMLIACLEDLELEQEADPVSMELADMELFYRKAKEQFDTDKAFANRARSYVVRLQAGDEKCLRLWKKLVDVTLAHNQAVYERLNVALTTDHVMGESAYNDDLPAVIRKLEEHQLISENEGAKVVFLEEFQNREGEPMGVVVEKSGGGFLYATTDLAAVRYRCEKLGANRVLYYVDARQGQHFEQIFTIARKAKFAPDTTRLEHHAFGMIMGKDGKPFKTRSGTTVKLVDLLDEAEERAARLIAIKSSELDEEQKVRVIKAVATGSVKYADLSKNRTSDYVFDWDQMLAFEGNTAPYLMYAYTRIRSIFRKSRCEPADLKTPLKLDEPSERQLALNLCRFSETLNQFAQEGMPHLLCGYLYGLAGAFMSFYEACPVNHENVEPDLRQSRLRLCDLTARTLKTGFDLLGLETVEQM